MTTIGCQGGLLSGKEWNVCGGGAAVGERLRNSPQLKQMVIVLMTAYKLSPKEEDSIINTAGADYL